MANTAGGILEGVRCLFTQCGSVQSLQNICQASILSTHDTVHIVNKHTDKKENKIFLIYIRKSRRDRLQSHIWLTVSLYIWLNICTFSHILGSPSSHVTLQPLPSEFPYTCGKLSFLFYQCSGTHTVVQIVLQRVSKEDLPLKEELLVHLFLFPLECRYISGIDADIFLFLRIKYINSV